jgi:hypothetical protein
MIIYSIIYIIVTLYTIIQILMYIYMLLMYFKVFNPYNLSYAN